MKPYFGNEIFSGRQQCQDVKFFRNFRDRLRLHVQGIAGGLVEPKLKARCPTLCCVCLRWVWTRDPSSYQFWFCQATKKPLKLGMGSVHETPEKLHILTRLPAREHFIDFCRRENFKTYITFWHLVVFQSCYMSVTISLYLLSFSSTGSTFNSYKISSFLLWSKGVHPDVLKNLIPTDINRFLSFCLTVQILLAYRAVVRGSTLYTFILQYFWSKVGLNVLFTGANVVRLCCLFFRFHRFHNRDI